MSSYLVTFALPYANGPLHLGHMVEMFDADIWVRARRLAGDDVCFVSGNDAHGTPIMLKAKSQGCTPEELVDQIYQSHKSVIENYNISVDTFSRTDFKSNQKWVYKIYQSLQEKQLIVDIEKEQAYDNDKKMFLPDRYVKGVCPQCGAEDQNGDNCEACGATYSPRDLIRPYSVVSDKDVTFKLCPQLELDLEKKRSFLKENVSNYTPKAILSKFDEWLDNPLKPWSISRHAPYHGVSVPDRENQHFYVWFDAPIGYLSFFDEALKKHDINVEDLLKKDSKWQLVHFIGKDIAYFHGLFWPVLLDSAGLKVPTELNIHGFLTINGSKMSKSKGTFIKAQDFSKLCHTDLLRYFLASKLNSQIDDINFEAGEFVEKINSDIIGKFINIISRSSKLLFQYADGHYAKGPFDTPLSKKAQQMGSTIDNLYQKRRYQQVCQSLMAFCDTINEAISQSQPWKTLKNPDTFEKAHQEITDILLAFKQLCYYLSPIMPDITEKLLNYFSQDSKLSEAYTPILNRLDPKKFKELTQVNTETTTTDKDLKTPQAKDNTNTTAEKKENDWIKIDDFLKVDLRVAKIIEASPVEGADKLVQIKLDLGQRTINVFAGIKKYYDCQDLIGKKVVACVNLQPRKMKFGLSEGMILAASDSENLSTLVLDRDIEVGSKIS